MDTTIKQQILLSAYRIRAIEEAIATRYAEQEMRCPTHLSIGQELVAAVYGTLISSCDYAVSTHRAHAHYLAKGGSLTKLIAELYGKESGCSKGIGGSMHLVDTSVGFMGSTAIVGGTIPVGVGLGLAIKIQNEDRISTVFLGDGATEEGVFYESLTFAALKELPVLFICENNRYSVYSPLEVRQPSGRCISTMVNALGVTATQADGYNIEDVYAQISQAIAFIKTEKKPYFLEFFTHRYKEHCGPNYDDHLNYRPLDESHLWQQKDPLHSISSSFLEEELSHHKTLISLEIEDAFMHAKNAPPLPYETLQNFVYRAHS